jgi:hypothetical protein
MSDKIDKIAPALLKAQQAMKGAKKDKVNPHLNNAYADLESVFEACKEPLNNAGIAIIQLMGTQGERNTHKTMLVHESGQFFQAEALLPAIDQKGINAAQAMGSAISYLRRYQLSGMAGVLQTDDDGNAAGDGNKEDETVKDKAYWLAQADKNTAHIKNLKAWYKKHGDEIKTLPVKDQDEINLYVKALGQKLEKALDEKKALEADAARGDGQGSMLPDDNPHQEE